jgi:hypothetical protein
MVADPEVGDNAMRPAAGPEETGVATVVAAAEV